MDFTVVLADPVNMCEIINALGWKTPIARSFTLACSPASCPCRDKTAVLIFSTGRLDASVDINLKEGCIKSSIKHILLLHLYWRLPVLSLETPGRGSVLQLPTRSVKHGLLKKASSSIQSCRPSPAQILKPPLAMSFSADAGMRNHYFVFDRQTEQVGLASLNCELTFRLKAHFPKAFERLATSVLSLDEEQYFDCQSQSVDHGL